MVLEYRLHKPVTLRAQRGESRLYPYHNEIKRRIRAGELTGYEYVLHYPRIGAALVLYFSTCPPVRPIRPHRCGEYEPLLEAWEAGRKGLPPCGR